ncbi:hypothetical protein PIB30_080119 [Stylosanthes scabra]|uniref:Uncharacterized protein n=1 Tax=Stylosanthes scabra TaxID=79078 RepID=A0ABU6QRY3_9FABA|nr:hypothetical protein [Stylosanthes scabra]
MPYALYETLDLGPLKKSKEVFTIVDASIVLLAGNAENVLVKICNEDIKPNKLLKSAERKGPEDPKTDSSKGKGLRIAPP